MSRTHFEFLELGEPGCVKRSRVKCAEELAPAGSIWRKGLRKGSKFWELFPRGTVPLECDLVGEPRRALVELPGGKRAECFFVDLDVVSAREAFGIAARMTNSDVLNFARLCVEFLMEGFRIDVREFDGAVNPKRKERL